MIIRTKELRYNYGDGTEALKGVDLEIEEGTRVAILGSNGAGKTTLMLHLNGVLRPSSGKVYFKAGELDYSRDYLSRLRARVGFVFQNSDDQLFAPTVLQDVAFAPMNHGFTRREAEALAYEALELLGIKKLAHRAPQHLSEGQKKRAAIAGVVALDPEVVIMDEPLASLDPKGREEVEETIEGLSGKTVVLSTHDVELAYRWADYIYLLYSGRVVSRGTPEEVFTSKQALNKARIPVPNILEIHTLLKKRGICSGKLPKALIELLLSIDDREGKQNPTWGKLTICSPGKLGKEELEKIGESHDFFATSGTKARVHCHRAGVVPDAIARAVERALLRAWAGEQSLLLAEDAGSTAEEVEALLEEFRLDIDVEVRR